MILFCVLCERSVDVSGMQLVRAFRGPKASRATYFDRKGGRVHVVLNEEASKKFQEEEKCRQHQI